MSYQVLARKWRPRDFSTLVGQEHVVTALTHALKQKRLHHAWLFTGTRGVGKTTLSRILAKALNCTGADGAGDVTAQPCGVCRACTEIDAGRFVDYIEMDAASNRGVDEMAQLLEKAIYAPSVGRYKVYMIDEVHMLTNHAFNSMLKTLEEPPEHVKFILATTDPQKIPVTVLSRCLQFNLKQMPPARIVAHLERVLAAEQIPFAAGGLRLLAQAANGSMRDALSLTDQAIAYSAGDVSDEAVRTMLGALDQTYLVRIADALVAADGPALLAIADEMTARSLSLAAALQDLGVLWHRLAVAQTVPAAVPDDWPDAAEIRRLAQAFDAQQVQLNYQITNQGRAELALAPDEYAGFTMTLLRMLAFRPLAATDAPQPAPRTAALRASAPAQIAVPAPTAPPAVAAAPKPVATSPALAALEAARSRRAPATSPTPAVAAPAVMPAVAPVERPAPARAPTPSAAGLPPWEEIPLSAYDDLSHAPPAVSQPAGAEPVLPFADLPADAPVVTPIGFDGNWPGLAARLPVKGMAQQLAQQTELVSMRGHPTQGPLTVTLRAAVRQVTEGAAVERLEHCLSVEFGRPVKLAFELGAVAETAAAEAAATRAQRQQQADDAVAADARVRQLIDEFDAKLVPGSIKPI